MKEKIDKFFFKGYHILCFAWLNVAIMAVAVIGGLMEGDWKSCIIYGLIYAPWTLFFFGQYSYHKKEVQSEVRLCVINHLIGIVENYKKLYGELPPEEPSEQEESEKQEKKDEDENKNE